MQKIVILLISFLLLLSVDSFTQETRTTKYEKQIDKITKKYFSICYFGYEKELTLYEEAELKMMTQTQGEKDFILGLGILNYANSHTTAEVKKLATDFERELERANSMKTSVDFQREREREQKIAAIKAEKEREERQEERQEEERERRRMYEMTDMGSIEKNIKDTFEKWQKKGEFEKTADYEERLKVNSKKQFDKICKTEIKNRVQRFISLDKELSQYNSESEKFVATFQVNRLSWNSEIAIPIEKAKQFKDNWSSLRCEFNPFDWGISNNSLCPNKFVLKNRSNSYDFKSSPENQEEIIISPREIGISNKYLVNITFTYSDAKKIEEETYQAYKQDLKKLADKYNDKLLENPYNVDKVTINNRDLSREGNLNYNFEQNSNFLKTNFEQLERDFERNLQFENPQRFASVFYSINPAKKIEANKRFLECRCNFENREDFDVQFIKDKLRSCDCRETDYRKYSYLFETKTEFNSYYDNEGANIYKVEIDKRIILNSLKENEDFIKTMNFKKGKKESFGSALGKDLLTVATGVRIQKEDYRNENELRKDILTTIQDCQNKPFYDIVATYLIEKNGKMNKEWRKNGQSFDSNTAFYEAYISENYKDILKKK